MRKISLLSKRGWHSNIEYYTKINAAAAERLGGWHSAEIFSDSCDFPETTQRLTSCGAATAALSGTEIGRLAAPEYAPLPFIDYVHGRAALIVEWTIAEKPTIATTLLQWSVSNASDSGP